MNENEVLNVSLSKSDSFSDSDYEIPIEEDSENIIANESEYEILQKVNRNEENIICIELMNNNKIYLNFDPHCKIRDLLSGIFRHKEFLKLYNDRHYSSKMLSCIFDLKLIIFRNIKEDTESKIDLDIKISELVDLGLIKSHKYPFLSLFDSRNFNKISKNLPFLKQVYENTIKSNYFKIKTHLDLIYRDYLPRCYIAFNLNNNRTDISDLYTISKQSVNVFSKLQINPLIGQDWFVYDDESLNFLMNKENFNESPSQVIKVVEKDRVMFQDKLPYMLLPNKEFKYILINVRVNQELKVKVDVGLTSTASEVLKKVNAKLQMPKPELCFDCKKKLLKVYNQCDYFLDSDSPLGLSTYITECIKQDITPELIIVDSLTAVTLGRRRSSSLNLIRKAELPTITSAKPINALFNMGGLNKNTNFCKVEVKNKPTMIKPTMTKKRSSKLMSLVKIDNDIVNTTVKTSTKDKIINIGVFNPQLLNYFKGLRKRNIEVPKEETELRAFHLGIDFEKLMMTSIEQKLKIDTKTQEAKEVQPLEVDVDNLVRGGRTRTKAISISNANTVIRVSGNTIRKHSVNKVTPIDTSHTAANSKIKVEEYISRMNANIALSSLNRPFYIRIHMLKLQDEFVSLYSLNSLNTSNKSIFFLELEAEIFCGSEPVTKSYKVYWKGISSDVTALINNHISFDIKYCDLPLFSSIIFRLKTSVPIPKDKRRPDGKTHEKKTIAWVNFKIFDHLKRLKTGMHKTSLWDTKFSDDAYFTNTDNYKENTGELYFELESFVRPVEYQSVNEECDLSRPAVKSISPEDRKAIDSLLTKSPYEDLTNEEKEILWRNRTLLCENSSPELVPKLLSCVNKRDLNQVNEVEKLILTCNPVPVIQALQLLSGNFLYDSIRKFAVHSLQQVSYLEVAIYLHQLVQSLKYEVYHDSPLANYLLKLAIKYPLTTGHQLFWLFKAEMSNVNFQQRFGLYLEIFLGKIGDDVRKIFEDEVWLIEEFLKISDIGIYNTKSNDEKEICLKEALTLVNKQFEGRVISIPYNFKLRVRSVKVSKCKFMKSKKKPLWLVFESVDSNAEDIYVMFKKGDDLRQDVLTLQLFKVMQNCWFNQGLELKMSPYEVVSTGHFQGLLQIVTNSETLATIHKEYGGLTAGFSNKPLKHWMTKIITSITEKEYVNNFMTSSAAYCVATFVLGIGDRHNDNIMLKKNGELFHIDFGHFLGHFKYKFGFKRERAPFVFTDEFCNVLGGNKSENFIQFKQLCVQAYMILRKNAEVLITILKSMLCEGIPELNSHSIKFLEYSLALKMNDSEAEKFILIKLEESMTSLSTKFNFACHLMASK